MPVRALRQDSLACSVKPDTLVEKQRMPVRALRQHARRKTVTVLFMWKNKECP